MVSIESWNSGEKLNPFSPSQLCRHRLGFVSMFVVSTAIRGFWVWSQRRGQNNQCLCRVTAVAALIWGMRCCLLCAPFHAAPAMCLYFLSRPLPNPNVEPPLGFLILLCLCFRCLGMGSANSCAPSMLLVALSAQRVVHTLSAGTPQCLHAGMDNTPLQTPCTWVLFVDVVEHFWQGRGYLVGLQIVLLCVLLTLRAARDRISTLQTGFVLLHWCLPGNVLLWLLAGGCESVFRSLPCTSRKHGK